MSEWGPEWIAIRPGGGTDFPFPCRGLTFDAIRFGGDYSSIVVCPRKSLLLLFMRNTATQEQWRTETDITISAVLCGDYSPAIGYAMEHTQHHHHHHRPPSVDSMRFACGARVLLSLVVNQSVDKRQ